MNRWWGSKSDSEKQSNERDQRAAKRIINNLDLRLSESEEEYGDANTSLHTSLQNITLNLDGAGDSGSESDTNDETMAEAELARQRALPVAEADFENDPDSWKKEVKIKSSNFPLACFVG